MRKEEVSVLVCESLFLDLFLGTSGVRRLMKRKTRKYFLSQAPERMVKQMEACRSMWTRRSTLCCPLPGIWSRISFQHRVRVGEKCFGRGDFPALELHETVP